MKEVKKLPRPAIDPLAPSTRERIYSYALKLFAEQGFDQAIIKTVAKNARVNETTFYFHFNGKHNVIELASERLVNFLTEKDPPIDPSMDVPSQLWADILKDISWDRNEFRYTWIILFAEEYRTSYAFEFIRKEIKPLIKTKVEWIIKHYQGSEKLKSLDIDEIADLVLLYLQQTLLNLLWDQPTTILERDFKNLVSRLMK